MKKNLHTSEGYVLRPRDQSTGWKIITALIAPHRKRRRDESVNATDT